MRLNVTVSALGFVGLGQGLEREGLIWRDTPRDIAEAADVVLTSVPNDNALEDVATGPDGLLAGPTEGKVWVDMSTVSPHVSRDVAKRVKERGAAMLDAPVSGSVPQVQSGMLTIMVGGDAQVYARVEPILRELGTPSYVGDNGQGLMLKLAINISLAVQMLAFAEGLLLAERAGVDRKRRGGRRDAHTRTGCRLRASRHRRALPQPQLKPLPSRPGPVICGLFAPPPAGYAVSNHCVKNWSSRALARRALDRQVRRGRRPRAAAR